MENRSNVLRNMEICRFCLREDVTLTDIYERNSKDSKQTVPLTLQLMACWQIEVYSNDGYPRKICTQCRLHTTQSYLFKVNCKKAEEALKGFLNTGSLVKPWTTEDLDSQAKQLSSRNLPISTPRRGGRPPSIATSQHQQSAKKARVDKSEIITLNFTSAVSQQSGGGSGGGGENNDEIDDEDLASTNQSTAGGSVQEEEEYEEEEEEIRGGESGGIKILNKEAAASITNSVNQSALQDKSLTNEPSTSGVSPHKHTGKMDAFPCTMCDRTFPLQQLLDLHVANHERPRQFKCMECSKQFYNKYDLLKHFKIHSNDKPYTCVVCDKAFLRESLLHRHERIHRDAPKHECSQCERTFLNAEDLMAHLSKHDKKRPFQCNMCEKSFAFKQGLERHEQTHSASKPHKCNYCEAAFNSAIKLTRHVTSHAGLRPYPCKLCGRTFLLSHHLTRHMRSHLITKRAGFGGNNGKGGGGVAVNRVQDIIGQYKCDVCSMSFKRKDSLINHSAIHSMVNLRCVICNTDFDNVEEVKEHIATHLSDLPYPCERCDYSFETQEQLEEHEFKHVEMEYEEQIEKEVLAEACQKKKMKKMRVGADDDDDDEPYNDINENESGVIEEMDEDGADNADEEYYSNEDVAEYTITNDLNNPQIVRRSKRMRKLKKFQDYLEDDEVVFEGDVNNQTTSVVDDENDDEHEQQRNYGGEQIVEHVNVEIDSDESIKPVTMRSEPTVVTKQYVRRTADRFRPGSVRIDLEPGAGESILATTNTPVETTTRVLNKELDLLSSGPTRLPPNVEKEVYNMKIGDKTVTVQKILITKDQMKAMAREGKIEKKGNTFVLKKPGNDPALANVDLDALMAGNTSTPLRVVASKKNYTRMLNKAGAGGAQMKVEIEEMGVEENRE